MNTEFKGTKEKIRIIDVHDDTATFDLKSESNKLIATYWRYNRGTEIMEVQEQVANIKLASDAFDTIQSCGLLPSELLKQRDEALELIAELGFLGNWSDKKQKEINDFIESTEVKP